MQVAKQRLQTTLAGEELAHLDFAKKSSQLQITFNSFQLDTYKTKIRRKKMHRTTMLVGQNSRRQSDFVLAFARRIFVW